jgi:cytochrome c oxidase subunit III
MSDAAAHAADVSTDQFGAATTGKIGMWIFLLSDAMSFAGLLIGYGILRAGSDVWPPPSSHLGIPFTALLTFLLICSSVTMVMAVAAASENKRRQTCFWLAATMLGGLLFLLGQRHEYGELIEKGMTLSRCLGCPPQFASTFYVITGFHGAHVTTGVIYLGVILAQTWMGKYDGKPDRIEIVGLFWHFVDLIWILVFTFVYLL